MVLTSREKKSYSLIPDKKNTSKAEMCRKIWKTSFSGSVWAAVNTTGSVSRGTHRRDGPRQKANAKLTVQCSQCFFQSYDTDAAVRHFVVSPRNTSCAVTSYLIKAAETVSSSLSPLRSGVLKEYVSGGQRSTQRRNRTCSDSSVYDTERKTLCLFNTLSLIFGCKILITDTKRGEKKATYL